MIEWIKDLFKTVMGYLGQANAKMEEIQVELDEFVDDVQDTVGGVVDKIQEEVEEAKSMLDKATKDEDK